MKKTDLHVHSRFSDHPSEWFLQRLGTSESYTEPDFVYDTAKKNGLHFVTLTDHNTIKGALYLKEKHPDDTFISVEATSYFPEDNCKIHVLIYDINESIFSDIEHIRTNIYELREYIKEKKLAYSVAHATYSVNNRLTSDYLEKLILLFDVFESINGARNKRSNIEWYKLLKELVPADIEKLYNKHKIEPISDDPWIKGFTGGSDDHAGLFIGRTYTMAQSETVSGFIQCLKNKETYAEGRHNYYHGLAFSIYKIAIDFTKTKSKAIERSPLGIIGKYIFEHKEPTFTEKIQFQFMRKKSKNGNDKESFNLKALLVDLIDEIREHDNNSIEDKLHFVYDKISAFFDKCVGFFFKSIEAKIEDKDFTSIFTGFFSTLPSIFVTIPFVSAFEHMFRTRNLVEHIRDHLNKRRAGHNKKILWFTDTLTDQNGVSVTLKTIGRLCLEKKKNLMLLTSLLETEKDDSLPIQFINIPAIHYFPMLHYENIKIKIPSFLDALKKIYEYDPDEIYISTPGPIGLIGLLSAKLMHIPCKSIYHTDFKMEGENITNEEGLLELFDSYINWFYSQTDEIKVPSTNYIDLLTERGLSRKKMSLFKRGLDNSIFYPRDMETNSIISAYNIDPNDFNLLFVGRISYDKNLKFLLQVFLQVKQKIKNTKLYIVGEGPSLSELQKQYENHQEIVFTGKISNDKLPEFYSVFDLFVFPSVTETFGMVILEAQACGLYCLVSDKGGPKEIVIDNETGSILPTHSKDIWVKKILELYEIKFKNTDSFKNMREKATDNILEKYNWDKVFDEWFETKNGNAENYQSKLVFTKNQINSGI